MSNTRPTLTRGPLPPEVYWRRRFFVGALALTLVFVIGTLLSGGSDGDDEPVAAQQAGAVAPTGTVTVNPEARRAERRARRQRQAPVGPTYGPTAPITELAEPSGRCSPAEVKVTPVVEEGVAGQDVTIGLKLQSTDAEACHWRVDRRSVALKILDGTTEIWTSRQCPRALPDERVVVRRVIATVVEMTWDGRESDADCSARTDWVLPGDFTLVASALGGEPGESTFDLAAPTARTVEVTPETSDTPRRRGSRSTDGAADDTTSGTAEETDAREPRR